MGRKTDFIIQAGRRVFSSIEELEKINAGLAARIAEETNGAFTTLLRRHEYALFRPKQYFTDLMAEHSLLREEILKLPGVNGQEILAAIDTPLPGHELFVAPYGSQLKMSTGRQLSAGGVHMDPHHILMTWKGLEYRQRGLIKGFTRQKGATVLIPEDMHMEIHQKNPPLYTHPYDALEADLERFGEVATRHGYSPQAIESVFKRVRKVNERFGIQPRGLRAVEAPSEEWGTQIAAEPKGGKREL